MATIYYEQHGDISRLKGKQVAILGYGSQGHAHALNLKESGVSVVVGLYPGSPSGEKAKADGLTRGFRCGSRKIFRRDDDAHARRASAEDLYANRFFPISARARP